MRIDLNSDLGEGYGPWTMGHDALVLDCVSSANIACGGHAGDPETMFTTLRLAAERGVVVGAHPGYADREGFGRRVIPMQPAEIGRMLAAQIGALAALARMAGTAVRYVKPHGALYNTIAHDERQGDDVISALLAIDPQLALLGLAGSPLIERARVRGLTVVAEAFADRAYNDDGTLVSRRLPGAVLHDADAVAERMLRWVQTGELTSISGRAVRLQADSICVHGDSPGAVEMARRLRQRLTAEGVTLKPFVH